MLKLFWNIFIYVLFMAWAFIFFENAVRSKYFIDEDNKLIFYPDNTQKGYVATREQIDECAKAFKKCFFFNIKGYRKDIERIFANSEIVNKKLQRKTFLKNQARRMSWLLLLSLIIIDIGAMFAVRNYKPLFIILLAALIPTIQLTYFKIKKD